MSFFEMLHTSRVIELHGNGTFTMEEQFAHPDGRVFLRRETLALSALPERLSDELLVNRFGYESVPSVAPPPATMTKEQYDHLRRRRVKKNCPTSTFAW